MYSPRRKATGEILNYRLGFVRVSSAPSRLPYSTTKKFISLVQSCPSNIFRAPPYRPILGSERFSSDVYYIQRGEKRVSDVCERAKVAAELGRVRSSPRSPSALDRAAISPRCNETRGNSDDETGNFIICAFISASSRRRTGEGCACELFGTPFVSPPIGTRSIFPRARSSAQVTVNERYRQNFIIIFFFFKFFKVIVVLLYFLYF